MLAQLVERRAGGRHFALFAGVARDGGVSIYEMSPTDESLESVFSYLVQR